MPMDTSSMFFGLLADKRRRAEALANKEAQAGQQMASFQQNRMALEDRELEREGKRAELASKYSEIGGHPVEQEYNQDPRVQQSAEVGRLHGAAYGEMRQGQRSWDRGALEQQKFQNRTARDAKQFEYKKQLQQKKTEQADKLKYMLYTLKKLGLENSAIWMKLQTQKAYDDNIENRERDWLTGGYLGDEEALLDESADKMLSLQGEFDQTLQSLRSGGNRRRTPSAEDSSSGDLLPEDPAWWGGKPGTPSGASGGY